MTQEKIINYINHYMNTEQANLVPTPASGFTDVDKDHPGEILVWIDPHRTVEKIILNVFSRKFRANSRGAASGGGSTSSSTNINHDHTVVVAPHNHASEFPSAIPVGDTRNFILTAGFIPTKMEIGPGTPTSTSASGGGSHSHTTPPHIHPLEYGIFEFGYYAPVQMRINNVAAMPVASFGTQGSESESFTCTGYDITSMYSPAGGSGKLAPGTNFLFFCTSATENNPAGLLRVFTEVQIIYR